MCKQNNYKGKGERKVIFNFDPFSPFIIVVIIIIILFKNEENKYIIKAKREELD